jgi:hypothetical protein
MGIFGEEIDPQFMNCQNCIFVPVLGSRIIMKALKITDDEPEMCTIFE